MPTLSCGYKCLQFLLITFNILVFACGIALIVIGSLSQVAVNNYSTGIDSNIKGLVIFIIILGCFLFLLGFLGFCGACTKNTCCLTIYAILLSVMVAAEIGVGIAAAVLKEDVKTSFVSVVRNSVSEYSKNPDIQNLSDKIQTEFKCCGSESSIDYTSTGQSVPSSCTDSDTGLAYQEGCSNKIIAFFEKYLIAVVVAAFAFAILQILSIVFTVCIIRAIKSGDTE
uniref:Tetraspanin n=1 Tax=Schistosoma japonicum TaxID=6182 RepID=C1LDM7_SCHJA|nr:CD63 antigen [Schistosoma japonicum]